MSAMSLNLKLPWPPSVNTYWRHVVLGKGPKASARTLISKKGREYRDTVARKWAHYHPPLTGRLSVEIDAHVPDPP